MDEHTLVNNDILGGDGMDGNKRKKKKKFAIKRLHV